MAVRLLPPGFLFLGNDGLPLDGGKIYTYVTGTSSNKTTYTDAGAGTPNANPVVLDTNGRADIWLDIDIAYRIIVKDSADNTLDTVDDVGGYTDMTGDATFFGDIIMSDDKCIEDDSNNEWLCFQKTTSAVNYFEMTNAATGNNPLQSVAGDDANIGYDWQVKGSSGAYTFKDHNGNELMKWGPGVASAVNYIKVDNAATGTGPTFAVIGDDANIDWNAQAQGTGVYNFKSTSNVATELRWFEDTDAGSNYVGWLCPADSVSTTYTWPVFNNTSGAVLVHDGAGGTSWDTGTMSFAATQADQETATSTSTFVSPGRQHYHPGHPKCWCLMDATGTAAIITSYNMTSITDNGEGDYTFTIDTDFSTANICYSLSSTNQSDDPAGSPQGMFINSKNENDFTPTAGSIQVRTANDNNVNRDPDRLCFVGFGDLA